VVAVSNTRRIKNLARELTFLPISFEYQLLYGFSFVHCPTCKNDSAHRSHRHGVAERVLSLFGWYPYRCRCGARFRFREDQPAESGHAKSVAAEIRASRATARRRLKRREFVLWCAAGGLFFAFLFYITRDHGSTSASEPK